MADVPISKAIECSTALPLVYKPVELKGRQLVDGGMRSPPMSTSPSNGAPSSSSSSTRSCPTSTTSRRRSRRCFGDRVRRVSDMGLPAIANQTFRLLSHARRHQAVEQWRALSGVDIVLVEPELDDELMSGTSIMDTRGASRSPARLRIGNRQARPRLRALRERSPGATASRSPAAASAGWSSAPPRMSRSRFPPGAASSSRPPRSCSASPARRH